MSLPVFVAGQEAGKPKSSPFARRWFLGLNAGPDFYYGDLREPGFWPKKNVSMAVSLFGHYYFTDVFGLRIQLVSGFVNGSKTVVTGNKTSENAFTGLFVETNVNGTVNFTNLFFGVKPGRRFTMYGTFGFGVSGWYSKLLNKVYIYDSLSTDNPLNNFHAGLVMPVGFGGVFRISDKIHAHAEWTFRPVFSDNLDNTVGGFKYDLVDYLAFGITFRVGGKGKNSHEKMNVLDYTYPVYPTTYQPPVQPPVQMPAPTPAAPVSVPSVEYTYVVQIFAFDKHNYSAEWIQKHYKVGYPVRRETEGTLSRYLIGNFRDVAQAKALRDEMLRKGIGDAFVVAYKDGVRHHTVVE